MGKFINQKGKIRVLAFKRCGIYTYVCRKGLGIYINYSIKRAILTAQNGVGYSNIRHNYESVNRIVKKNPILKLRDHQPDGLLILQAPKQLTLGI